MSNGGVTFPNGDPKARLRAFKRAIVEGTVSGVTEVCFLIQRQAKQNITDLDKVDQGTMRGSVDVRIDQKPTVVNGVVFVGAEWGPWVEFGRKGAISDPTSDPRAAKAAFPPVTVIAAWVRRQYRKLKPSGVTKSGRARKPKDGDIKSAAFLIARKIFRFGIKPAPFLTPAYDQFKGILPSRVYAHVMARKAAIK